MARIIAGVFAGLTCEVLSMEGDNVTVRVTLFGRPREETLPRADVEMAGADPRRSLRAEIEDDIELFGLRLEGAFFRERAQLPEGDALEEWQAYEAHQAATQRATAARREALLARFDAEIAPLPDAQVVAAVRDNAEHWLAEATERARLKALWRADNAAFEAESQLSERAFERKCRAGQAAHDRDYLAFRAARWSDAERLQRLSAAERALEARRVSLVARVRDTWGLTLPEGLFRFWLFLQTLQDCEQQVLADLELSPFGITDLFGDPDAQPRDGIDVRVHGRFYRDPPEMLTFLHGGSDGLHFGLFYDDGDTASGVVRYYNNDGIGLGRPHGTPLMAVRDRLENAATQQTTEAERPFALRLLREAIQRFETGDRPEQGEAYLRAYASPSAAAEHPYGARLPTLDEAGAWIAPALSAVRAPTPPLDAAAAYARDQQRWDAISTDDPIVRTWVAEAKRQLDAGDPMEALCLGRDLHWRSAGDPLREALACELLVLAYRALGRPALAGIAEAHRRFRSLGTAHVL